MPSPDPLALDPISDVLVSPGYLAGPGDSHSIFNALDLAPGWTKAVAFGTDTYYTSPCQRVRVANAAESFYGGWTVSYAEDPLGVPDWITTFDRNTPHEIVAAFTKTLVNGLHNNFADYLSGGQHYTGISSASLTARHRWEPVHGSRPFRTVSPDGHAAYQMRVGWLHEYDELLTLEKSTWRMSVGTDPVYAPSWQAFFSRYTPQHLIAASTAAFTDPTPVARALDHIPDRHRSLVSITREATARPNPLATAALARSTQAQAIHAPPRPTAPTTIAMHAGSRRQR
ncbi:DUF317 domain-containing protein [Streptomyces cahuitamycinicus]|uniref:DUF317 domain-containing protein n=1 Tax=Streptomyces cahuitamycinicus TaxID=2070367 RepID=A0A2N8TWU3_9ACTN|nr:DUF317 domain-containing protein [Streptomyces cahuitamycinicus]PNG23487.1 hypothetical protein C1J00_03690 [Streptomyces cahuitamycinicus]